MNKIPTDQLEEIRLIHDNFSVLSEAGHEYVLLKNLKLPDGCEPNQSDALFYPDTHHGYEARLFFPMIIKSRVQRNWHVTNKIIFGKSWNAFSWKLNINGLRSAEMLTMLLGALQ